MKKAVSAFLVIIMIFTVLTISTPVAFAASYSGECGEDFVWELDTYTGTLTVAGFGEMPDFDFSSAPSWDRYQGYIKSVVFEDGISYVGACSFYNGGSGYKYKKLTSVDFGTVDSIGEYAFRGCSAISEVSGDYVTSVGDHAFRGCDLSGCLSFPFPSVETIGNGAFYGCQGLSEINLPSTVTTVGGTAFENCDSVTSITLPTSVVNIYECAFADCDSVTEINYNSNRLGTGTSSVVGNGIFSHTGADSGVTLNISNHLGTIPDNLFSFCYNLRTVTGGTGVSSIGDFAFAHTGITSFAINAGVSKIGDCSFADCTSLTYFTASPDNEYFSADSNGVLLNKEGNQIIKYPAGKTATSYTIPSSINVISAYAFSECKYLTTFTAGTNIIAVSSNCFANCPALSTVTLASTVDLIGTYAFLNCPNLTSISMPGIKQINAYGFAECDGLSSFSTTSILKLIDDYAFYGCDNLTTVNIVSGTTSIGKYAFYSCKSLASVSIAGTVNTIGEGAFSFCSSLQSVTLKSGIKTIDKYAFLSCTALKSVTVPSSVTTINDFALGFEFLGGNQMGRVDGFKMYCYSGSAAQTYARNNSLTSEIVTNSQEEILIETEPVTDEPAAQTSIWETVINAIMSFDYIGFIKNVIIFILDFLKG